jgi:hypothetical protein
MEITRVENYGDKLLVDYIKFSEIYQFLKNNCGDTVPIENLAWRLHSEILNFESEA